MANVKVFCLRNRCGRRHKGYDIGSQDIFVLSRLAKKNAVSLYRPPPCKVWRCSAWRGSPHLWSCQWEHTFADTAAAPSCRLDVIRPETAPPSCTAELWLYWQSSEIIVNTWSIVAWYQSQQYFNYVCCLQEVSWTFLMQTPCFNTMCLWNTMPLWQQSSKRLFLA